MRMLDQEKAVGYNCIMKKKAKLLQKDYLGKSTDSLMLTLNRLLSKEENALREIEIMKFRLDKVEKFIFKKFGFEISAV